MGNSRRIIKPYERDRRAANEAVEISANARITAALTQPSKADLREMLAAAVRNTRAMEEPDAQT